MACSIALKRPHEFEPYSAEANLQSSEGAPAVKKLRPCSFSPRFGGASLNINMEKMTLAARPKSSSMWKAEAKKAPCLPPPPNLKEAQFEASNKYSKPSQLMSLFYAELNRMKRRKYEDSSADSSQSSQQAKEGGESPTTEKKMETTMLSLKQACHICERLLKQQEESLQSEYEQALIEKLSEQYSTYINFSQDQLQSNNIDHSESYIS